jgi:RES domain
MPNVLPPGAAAGTPVVDVLPADTILFRVHRKGHPAHSLNPNFSHRYYGGGRFDSTADDVYPFLYAGESVNVALSETLLRDLSVEASGPRLLPKAYIRGRRVSAVRVRIDLDIVSLVTGAHLGQVSQDPWLTTCEPRDYAQSRHWGHTIRGWAPAACGFVWMSRRDPGLRSYVLFGDRCAVDPLEDWKDPSVPTGAAADLDTAHGVRWLRQQLAGYGVTVTRR